MAHINRLLILLCLSAISTSAADIYFSQSGAGAVSGANCANAYALARFNTADANWTAGNTLHLCGNWIGAANGTLLVAQASGSLGNVITIIGETGANLTAPYWSLFGGAFDSNGKNYITFDGGTDGIIQNTQNGTGLTYAVGSRPIWIHGSSNITVKHWTIANTCVHTSTSDFVGCSTSGNFDAAIWIDGISSGSVSNILVTLNTQHDSNTAVFYQWAAGDSAVQITKNSLSRNNWGIGAGGSGTTATGLLIDGNDISCVVGGDCNWTDTGNNFHHNGIIILPINTLMNNLVISNNYFHDVNPSTGHVFLDDDAPANDTPGAKLYNNISYTSPGQLGPQNGCFVVGTDGSDVLVANNTCVGGGTGTTVGIGGGAVRTVIKNNIASTLNFAMLFNAGYAGMSSDYNSFYSFPNGFAAGGVFYSNLPAWQVTGFDTHSISANPLLSATFNLGVGSPAILAATNLTGLGITGLNSGAPQTFGVNYACGTGCLARPATGPWDIGAYPSGGAPPPPTPNPPTRLRVLSIN